SAPWPGGEPDGAASLFLRSAGRPTPPAPSDPSCRGQTPCPDTCSRHARLGSGCGARVPPRELAALGHPVARQLGKGLEDTRSHGCATMDMELDHVLAREAPWTCAASGMLLSVWLGECCRAWK